MSRMSNIDLTIQYIKNWFKEHTAYIIAAVFVLVMALAIYKQADKDIMKAVEKENRIINIEERLTKQERYMHQVQAELDNLKEVHK